MSTLRLEGLLNVPASGIAWAAGSSLIGTAVGGPVGGAVFALSGAAIGIFTEMASLKRHEQQSKLMSADHKHE
jgi:hypothetical protein